MTGARTVGLAMDYGCRLFLLSFILTLSACDNSDGGGGAEEEEPEGLRLSVYFPPRYSITDGDSITFHGRATDGEGVDFVEVNGEPATTDDGYLNWEITLSLAQGTNEFEVVAENDAGDAKSVAVTIRREVPLLSPQRLAIDDDNDRILVTDDLLQSVIAIDMTDGTRSIFSGVELANPFSYPFEIAIDSISVPARALVLDALNGNLYEVDLADGARTVLSPGVISFGFDKDLIIDSFGSRALVLDSDTVKAVDLETGDATVLSDATYPNTDNVIDGAFSMAQDGGGRILVMEGDRVIAVNSLGFREVLSNQTLYPYYHSVSDCAFDSDYNRLLSIDASPQRTLLAEDVAAVDPPRSVLVENLPLSGFGAVGIAVDNTNARVLATDSEAATILAIDPLTDQSSILWHNSTPDTNNTFALPEGIVVDSVRNRALVIDTGRGILAVNLVTGARTVFSDSTTPDDDNILFQPSGIALDAPDNRLLVVDRAQDLVMAVNLASGVRTVLSDATTPNSMNVFDNPQQIAIDRANNRALVTDSGLDAIVAVNLDTGARTILSNNASAGLANANFGDPRGIAVDAANNRALVTDTPPGVAIIAVDLNTGARSVFSSNTIPSAAVPLSIPWGIYVDVANNRALVGDVGRSAILALSLTDGSRSAFSSNIDTSNTLISPMGIAQDVSRRRLLVLDGTADSVLAVQPDTGERVIFSK
jgi:hypothetical protein